MLDRLAAKLSYSPVAAHTAFETNWPSRYLVAAAEGFADGEGDGLPTPDFIYVTIQPLWKDPTMAALVRREWLDGLNLEQATG